MIPLDEDADLIRQLEREGTRVVQYADPKEGRRILRAASVLRDRSAAIRRVEAISVDDIAGAIHRGSCLNAAVGVKCGHGVYGERQRNLQAIAVHAIVRAALLGSETK